MVEIVIICKDGTINSYLSSLVIAINEKKKGRDISVVFMQEGLVALIDKKFRYAPSLKSYIKEIEKNANTMGVPTNPFELIKEAKKLGVPLYACQAWMKLLGGKPPKLAVPEGLDKLELSELVDLLAKANKVFSI
jgi:peroxiredoxin family protein